MKAVATKRKANRYEVCLIIQFCQTDVVEAVRKVFVAAMCDYRTP